MKKLTIIITLLVLLAAAVGAVCLFQNRGSATSDFLQSGNEALLAGEWAKATELFTAGLAEKADDKDLLYARAAAQLAKAKDSYNLAAASATQGETERAQQEVTKADENFTAARNDAEQALTLAPDFYQAGYLIGCIDMYQGQWFEALDRFTQVIKQAPDYAPGWQRRGEVYSQIGDVANAMIDFKKAAALGYTSSISTTDTPQEETSPTVTPSDTATGTPPETPVPQP